MADLYGTSANATSSTIESEEMPWFLQNLIGNSSSKQPSSSPPFNSDLPIGDGSSTVAVGSSSAVQFSDPGGFFPVEVNESVRNSFSSSCAEDCDAITPVRRKFPLEEGVQDFDFGAEEHLASEIPPENVLPRSSKRTRAAEIHNLSEKKRRSRINEKLKALQNLVPNSNKTDKASMLDEAIEYLKQLQLQVQMLTMRNGLSLPGYLPQTQQPLQLHQRGVDYGEENLLSNANKRDLFSGNQEISTQTPLYISNQIPRNQPHVIPSATDITDSDTLFGLEPMFEFSRELSFI